MTATKNQQLVDLVIVAKDSAALLGNSLLRLPRSRLRSIIVVDNGSKDNTAQVARDHGAVVLRISKGGYGRGVRRALKHLESLPVTPDIVVFFDPRKGHDISELEKLLVPFEEGRTEMVIATSSLHKNSLDDKAILNLINVIYGHRYTELSSFRALRYSALVALGLNAEAEGWGVELLVKAVRLGLHIIEVPLAPMSKRSKARRKAQGNHPIATGRKLLKILRHSLVR